MQPNKSCKRLAVLTCVTNDGRVGPGHTAIVLDSTVYSFEGLTTNSKQSSWKVIPVKRYLASNTHRPVVVQELKKTMDPAAVYQFIYKDDQSGADYGVNGLCSQRAALALSAASTLVVDPVGMNTPYNLYSFLETMGVVRDRYHIGNPGKLAKVFLSMRCSAAAASQRKPVPILTW